MASTDDTTQPLALIVHGGASEIPAGEEAAYQQGCEAAAKVGWRILREGGSALDAVEEAICTLENDPTFNAGRGSSLTAEGSVQMDASIMDGQTLGVGAVAAIEHLPNPIALARLVMERSEHHLLVATWAEDFARAQGLPFVSNESLITPHTREAYEKKLREQAGPGGGADTVGVVALDRHGRIVAGASTGGLSFSLPGRVGDTPMPGSGLHADNRFGGVACTGDGEMIMRVCLALRASLCLEEGLEAAGAAVAALDLFKRRTDGEAGLIVVDRQGRVGLAHNSPHMSFAYYTHQADHVISGIVAHGETRGMR